MATSMKELGIDRLSAADRLTLLQEIWDSLTAEGDASPLTNAQEQDLQRRLAAYEANPELGASWEEVKARLQDRP